VLIADNHIYVRGAGSKKITGIHVADHAVNVNIHDNLVENCHYGFRTGTRVYVPRGEKGPFENLKGQFEFHHTESEVAEALGPRAFRDKALPHRCDDRSPYRGWILRWLTGAHAGKTATIESFGAKDRMVMLKEAVSPRVGDRFAVYPRQANWQVHHNTFSDCAFPLAVDLFSTGGVHINNNAM